MHPDAFDLAAYLKRLGCEVAQAPTLETLSRLCAAHAAAIPFENIGPLLGDPPSLSPDEIQAKLVGSRRGGYCFEQNALLRLALRAIGFEVSSLAARVMWMAAPSSPPRARTHMLLSVEVPGGRTTPCIADVGFGGHLVNAPLRLEPSLVQRTRAGELRLLHDDAEWTLETRLPAGWAPLYRFQLVPQQPVDYEPLNWFTATHPASIFRHNLLMERLTAATRATLLNDRLTLRQAGTEPQTRVIASAADFARVLDQVFDIAPPIDAAALFERVPKGLAGIAPPSRR